MDVTRTVSRAGLRPTGIDRIERAYIEWLCTCETSLLGILRTKLGYLLLDKSGCQALLAHCETPLWSDVDLLSRTLRRKAPHRAVTETGLRKLAIDRAVSARLTHMLKRNLPSGSVYLNVGQTNLNDRMVHAVRACADARIVVYLHDTIPLDFPEVQTPASRLKFKQFFARTDRFADLVLCNSKDTNARILQHSQHLRLDQVHVLTPGLPKIVPGEGLKGPWTGHPYFMVIGTIEPRKNIGFLLDIWEKLDQTDAPHLLVCGRRGWLSEDVFTRLDAAPRNAYELTNLDDATLWALLKDSNGLLFPSQAEGFGYPALEAASLSVPVVCSPLPALKNLLGEYAIYADPTERYIWVNKINQLAQRRRGQSGEQLRHGAFDAPSWQAHFNTLFTLL